MKKLPLALRIILNAVFFIVYVLVFSLVVSFLLLLIPMTFWLELIPAWSPIFAKVQIFIVLIVAIVTLLLRKYFYLNLRTYDEESDEKETDFKLHD